MSAQPRLPYAAPRRLDPRLALAVAFAAGGAAVASLFLMRDLPAWLVPGGAVAAGLYGGIALFCRTRAQLAVALAVAAPLTFSSFALVLVWSDHTEPSWGAIAVASIVLGLGFAALFGVPVLFSLAARRAPAHDTADRLFVAASLWLCVVAGGAAGVGAIFGYREGKGLGHGGLTWLTEALALALGAGLAGVVLARDLGRRRFLRAVGKGSVPAWEIVPSEEMDKRATPQPILRYLTLFLADGALVSYAAEGTAPFRRGSSATTEALVPLDPAPVARLLRTRIELGGALLLVQGAGAAVLGAALLLHCRPLTGVVEVAIGGAHTCARLADGGVRCWGMNREGQLGDGTTQHSYAPVAVVGLDDAQQIAAGDLFTCALRRGGAVVCWGETDQLSLSPMPVAGLPPARRLSASGHVACVVTMNDDVYCWGTERDYGPSRFRWRPVRMDISARGGSDFAAGSYWVCLRRADELRCRSQLDPDRTTRSDTPMCLEAWSSPAGAPLPIAGSLISYDGRVCEADADGRARCWGPEPEQGSMGTPPDCQRAAVVPGVEGARRVAFRQNQSCALDAEGRVRCWDARGRGGAVVLEGVTDLVSDHDGFTICAVRADGTAWCWGDPNDYGELGDGTRRAREAPVLVRR